MSSSRRSSRARKTINYSKYGQESDDDFTESTGSQPNKKSKLSKESTKQNPRPKRENLEEDTQRRVPVDDKVYQRNLDLALKISKKENIVPPNETKDLKSNNLEATPTDCDAEIKKNMKKDQIICNQSPRKHRQAATKALITQQKDISEEEEDDDDNVKNKDEDYSVNNASEDISESDDDDDDDEDFNDNESNDSEFELSSKKKNKSKKKSPNINNSSSAASKPKPRLSATVIHISKTANVQQNISKIVPNCTHSPKVSSFKASKIISPVKNLKSVWVPPGPARSSDNSPGGVSIRSPTSSGLRLGLSRKQVLKPLHTSIKIQ